MPFTTVLTAPAKAKEGLLYDAQGSPDGIITGIVDLAAGIKPGRLVVRTATDDWTGALPAAAASLDKNVLGVSLFSHKGLALVPASSNNELYEDGAEIPIARQRRVWVKCEDAFTPASAVYVRVAAGAGGTEIGAFRTDADTATAVAWAAARWLSSGGAGAFGVLEINI